jgi:DNA polymerase bacteriophage-type
LWVPGDPVPEVFVEAANNPDWVVSAFNNRFERAIEQHIMAPRYGFPLVPLERHRCTQAAALSLALPFSLEAVAKALGVAEKDEVGRQLMLKMAKPRKPKKGEDETKTYWLDDADRRARLYEYCRQDVVVERAIHARVGHLSESEQEIWRLDQIVNDRGVYVDAEFIDAAIVCGEKSKAAVDAELAQITGGMINSAHQDEKIKAWVKTYGVEIEDVQKPTVEEILTRENLPEKARRVLELRLEGAHAAAAKYKTMKVWRCPDRRVRGTLDYHGASTGRWSSHGIQLRNLKREAVVTVDTIARILGDEASLKEIGDAVRYAICAAPGATLFSVDYSGVESRYTAWIAGEQKKLAQWAKFDATGKAEDEPYFQIGKLFASPMRKRAAAAKPPI